MEIQRKQVIYVRFLKPSKWQEAKVYKGTCASSHCLLDLQTALENGAGELHTEVLILFVCVSLKKPLCLVNGCSCIIDYKMPFSRVVLNMTRVPQGLCSVSQGSQRLWCLRFHNLCSPTTSSGLFREAYTRSSIWFNRSQDRPAFMLDKEWGGSPRWTKYIYGRNRLQILQWSLGHELS